MKKNFLIATLLAFTCFAYGQTFKFQAGISSSSLNWKTVDRTEQMHSQKITGYSLFFGLDYLQKKYFNLSSNVGIIRKGGEDADIFSVDPLGQPLLAQRQKAFLNYLSVNTTLDLKYPVKEKLFPFVSFGPRIDYLISNNSYFNFLKETKELNKLSYGINLGAGIKYQFSRFQIGIRGDYLLNFKNISDYIVTTSFDIERRQLKDKTFLANVTFDYKLK